MRVAPVAACAARKHRRQQPRVHRINRHSLRNGFNGFLRALPGDRAFLPPSLARRSTRLCELSASVGAPEPHDFTVRLLRHSSDDVPRPSHPAPNVRDDREPPLLWVRDKREHRFDLPDNAIPGTCDRLARRASHHLACSHPRVSQLSSVAGCGSAAFPSPQCPQLR
jgi:hypothetical protein